VDGTQGLDDNKAVLSVFFTGTGPVCCRSCLESLPGSIDDFYVNVGTLVGKEKARKHWVSGTFPYGDGGSRRFDCSASPTIFLI